jgi:hypothetical protein
MSEKASRGFQALARRLDCMSRFFRATAQCVPLWVQLKQDFEPCSPPALWIALGRGVRRATILVQGA